MTAIVSNVCKALYLHKELGTADVGNKIVLDCCRVVSLHIFAYSGDVVLVLDIYT